MPADFEAGLKELTGESSNVRRLVSSTAKVALSKLASTLRACRPGGCGRSSPACAGALADKRW
jgi:hypothetical protein